MKSIAPASGVEIRHEVKIIPKVTRLVLVNPSDSDAATPRNSGGEFSGIDHIAISTPNRSSSDEVFVIIG